MPRDPRKREKAVMKRRRQQEATRQKQSHQGFDVATAAPRAIIRHARSFPIAECWIARGWEDDAAPGAGLVQVLLARAQPDGALAFGVYMVDRYCLGLKETFCNAGISQAEYEGRVRAGITASQPLEPCAPELAHQLIYQSIDYAARFGFRPHRDFADSQFLLEPRGTFEEAYAIPFGRDGKPFFVAGPHDNVPAILARLEKAAGPGNYDYLVPFAGDAVMVEDEVEE
jgi:hypothetical protein